MAQHISRKELKKDEVRETLAHGAKAVLSHQQFVLFLAIGVILAAAGFYGWRAYTARQTMKASMTFDAAMKVFQTPVGTPPAPGETSYATDPAKFTAAEGMFSSLAAKYPRTRAGHLARYYAALCDEKLGKPDDAKKWLGGLLASRDVYVAGLAKFELAALDDRTGQDAEAVKLYEELIAKPPVLVPKAVAMLALADHYRQKDPSKAAQLYGQIKSEYPDTPIAEQASRSLSLLPGQS